MKKKIIFLIAIPVLVIAAVLFTGSIYRANAVDGMNITNGKLISYTGTAEDVVIPSDVKTIGREAFLENPYVKNVTIGHGVQSIEYGAFRGCTSLASIIIPDSVTSVKESAFMDCTSLAYAAIGTGLYELGAGAFSGCDSLVDVIIDPANLFYVCDDGVILSRDKTRFVQYLAGRHGSTYAIPGEIKTIDRYAFWGADKLKQITVPGISVIPEYAFAGCTGLEDIIFSEPSNEISMGACKDCASLRQVSLPISISTIHSTAFEGCPIDLYFNCDDMSSAAGIVEGMGFAHGNMYIYDTSNLVDETVYTEASDETNAGDTSSSAAGSSAAGSSEKKDPDKNSEKGTALGATEIVSDRAFLPVYGSIAVNKGTAKAPEPAMIKDYAHYMDTSLTSFELPEDISAIGSFSFARSGLVSVNIPEGVSSIGKGAFYHCDGLLEVSVPSTVTQIGEKAFEYTAWYNDWLFDDEASDLLIVGDGVLIGYKGDEADPELPDTVKTIAPGVLDK
ncbi:MAG: leucine-rich repeat domain-containing protein [Lachnospiraceae bacterium]|nr:leucine-rich repeat domain-containing protein [Lachnospiraceae bacterium]